MPWQQHDWDELGPSRGHADWELKLHIAPWLMLSTMVLCLAHGARSENVGTLPLIQWLFSLKVSDDFPNKQCHK